MSDTMNLLCCIPVFLLWFGPGALAVFCLGFNGCAHIQSRWNERESEST